MHPQLHVPAARSLLGTRDGFRGRKFFHRLGVGGGFGMIQVRYIYCVVFSYYYYVSSTSDHLAGGTGSWGPLL